MSEITLDDRKPVVELPPLNVIFDDANFLVFNKPANVYMEHATLPCMHQQVQALPGAGRKVHWCHQIDCPTSGALVSSV